MRDVIYSFGEMERERLGMGSVRTVDWQNAFMQWVDVVYGQVDLSRGRRSGAQDEDGQHAGKVGTARPAEPRRRCRALARATGRPRARDVCLRRVCLRGHPETARRNLYVACRSVVDLAQPGTPRVSVMLAATLLVSIAGAGRPKAAAQEMCWDMKHG